MTRLPELSVFFPLYNEEANVEALVEDALAVLPELAERYEIILVDDGSRDFTPERAGEAVAEHPDVVRLVRHERNRGYGGALRSGFRAARYRFVAFTDGDRQFRLADLATLIERHGAGDAEVVIGYRIKRADPPVRILYARLYKLALGLFWGLRVRDVDCAFKLIPTAALEEMRLAADGPFFSAELLIRLQRTGLRIAQVGVPHYPRTAGSPTGAKPSVILRAVREFWSLRVATWLGEAGWARGGSLRGPEEA